MPNDKKNMRIIDLAATPLDGDTQLQLHNLGRCMRYGCVAC